MWRWELLLPHHAVANSTSRTHWGREEGQPSLPCPSLCCPQAAWADPTPRAVLVGSLQPWAPTQKALTMFVLQDPRNQKAPVCPPNWHINWGYQQFFSSLVVFRSHALALEVSSNTSQTMILRKSTPEHKSCTNLNVRRDYSKTLRKIKVRWYEIFTSNPWQQG